MLTPFQHIMPAPTYPKAPAEVRDNPSTLLYQRSRLKRELSEARKRHESLEAEIRAIDEKLAPAFPDGSSTYVATEDSTYSTKLIHVASNGGSITIMEVPVVSVYTLAFPAPDAEGGAA